MLQISDAFRQVLSEIAERSVVAYLMLHYRGLMQYEAGNYLHYEGDQVSYVPTKHLNQGWMGPRVSGKPGRIVAKFVPRQFTHYFYDPITMEKRYSLTDADFEIFVNLLKATQVHELTIREVSGEDIRKWYHVDCYHPTSYMLMNSCMRYDETQDYLDIYVHNPDVCTMAIMTDQDDMLHARALMWLTEQGVKHDRIYGNDINIARMERWFEESKITRVDCDDVVVLNDANFYSYPYLDTLAYLAADDNKLSGKVIDGTTQYCKRTDGETWAVARCTHCHEALVLQEDDYDRNYVYIRDQVYCYSCYDEYRCRICGVPHDGEDNYCDDCQENGRCEHCGEMRPFSYWGNEFGDCTCQDEQESEAA